ncbi:MAG: tetratricopeptide repeat protein, partial [Defluviitaleaceae bacterium]|nr:tetratricopeptide repeat protein [Defluviitaleaceae bacterium]
TLNRENPQHMYLHTLNLRLLSNLDLDYEKAIEHGKKAIEIAKNSKELLPMDIHRAKYNVASDYTKLHQPLDAIVYLKDIENFIYESRANLNPFQIYAEMLLGLNYARAGKHEEAEEILQKSLKRAKSIEDEKCIGVVLYNQGAIKQIARKWEESREHFKEATEHLAPSDMNHFWCVFGDIQSAIMDENLAEAREMLAKTKNTAENYTDKEMAEVLFQYLECIQTIVKGGTIYRRREVKFTLEKAIPLFLEHSMKFEAMWAYEVLSTHYNKARKEKQSAEMYIKSLETYKTLFVNE